MATMAADRGEAVLDVGAAHRRAVEDRVGEALELAAVEMAVGAERLAAPVASRSWKMSTSLALEVPGVEGLREDEPFSP